MNEQPFKTLVWNVRGLNSPARRNAILQVIMAAQPSVVCFQETKMDLVTLEVVRHCHGTQFEQFFYLPVVGTRGGILLAWDASVVQVSSPHYTKNTLTALVRSQGG